MRNALLVTSLLGLSLAVVPACATKNFVRTEVGQVHSKVDTLSRNVEETQARTIKNEEPARVPRRPGHVSMPLKPLHAG